MVYFYYNFFGWYLSDEQLQIENAFEKGITAFLAGIVFILYVHLAYFPKLLSTPLIPTFPPLIMLFSLNVGLGLGVTNLYVLQIYQLPSFLNPLRSVELGFIFIMISFILIYLSVGKFRNHDEDPNPTTETYGLITTGVFNYVRNPMYLSLILFQFGCGLALSFLHISLMSLATGILLHFFVVLREEKYLQMKFGLKYDTYVDKSRRWI